MPEAIYVPGARIIDNPDNTVRYEDMYCMSTFDPETQNLYVWARALKTDGAKADSASDIYDSVNAVLEERCGIVCVDRPESRVRIYPDIKGFEITYYPSWRDKFNQTHFVSAEKKYNSDELYAWLNNVRREYGNEEEINSHHWYEISREAKRVHEKIQGEMPIEVWTVSDYQINLPIGAVTLDVTCTFVLQGGRILNAAVRFGQDEKIRYISTYLWDANDVRTRKGAKQNV